MAGSVSSHLSPEPERRLWIIFELMQDAAASAEQRLAAIAGLAVLELALLRPGGAGALILALCVPVALLGLYPLRRLPPALAFLEPPKDASGVSLVTPEDIAKCLLVDLIHRMDRYLGGGVTSTQYYEDIVAEILAQAYLAVLKRRVLRAVCVAVALAQLLVLR